jgi:hypothetical protein
MISSKGLNNLIKIFLWGTAVTGALLLCVASSHCATTSTKHNAIGFVQYTTNPLMYLAANIAQNQDAITNVDGNLNMRLKPLGTNMLYDESILFCGLPVDKFKGIAEPFVLTYRRQASHLVQGIGCHELVRVDAVKVVKQ